MLGETKKCQVVNGRQICITTRDCDPLDPACVPTTISSKARMNMRGIGLGLGLVPHPFNMITPSWAPMPHAPTLPQLQGPWAVARGQELPSMFTPAAKTILTLGSAALCAYHGTRRNGGSIFWGTVWFALGAAFPVVTPIFALGQGIGDCANNCRREPTERR